MKNLFAFLISLTVFLSSFGQIPPGYYDNAIGLTGNNLKSALHNIIDNHVEYSYDDLRDFILEDTDEDPNNSNNIILLYTGRSQNKNTFGGGANEWNREHVWAKSHGGFGNSPPCGTDAHHLRPTDASVNSARGNKDFDNGGEQHPEATGCYFTGSTWEPRDEVKGDVARMIFYMSVRYEGGGGEPDLEVVDWVNTSPNPQHGKFSTLMSWHVFDPPDAFEINRNNVIYGYQNNRNPFIDHPEFLGMMYPTYTGIDDNVSSPDFTVYPSPANSSFTIELSGISNSNGQIIISNSLGQEIYSGSITNDLLSINSASFVEGLYIANINVDGNILTKKFIVKH